MEALAGMLVLGACVEPEPNVGVAAPAERAGVDPTPVGYLLPAMFLAAMRRRPKTWALLTWAISVALLGAAVLLATFGAHPLWFVALALWLLTLGLPTTIAFVLALAVWNGQWPTAGLPRDVAFFAAAAAGALLLQFTGYVVSARMARRASAGPARDRATPTALP